LPASNSVENAGVGRIQKNTRVNLPGRESIDREVEVILISHTDTDRGNDAIVSNEINNLKVVLILIKNNTYGKIASREKGSHFLALWLLE